MQAGAVNGAARPRPRGLTSPPANDVARAAETLKAAGRYEDEEIAHVAPGEIIIPVELQTKHPEFMDELRQIFIDSGYDPDRYIVADTAGPNHKLTGLEEFFSEGDGPNGQGQDGGESGSGPGSGENAGHSDTDA